MYPSIDTLKALYITSSIFFLMLPWIFFNYKPSNSPVQFKSPSVRIVIISFNIPVREKPLTEFEQAYNKYHRIEFYTHFFVLAICFVLRSEP